MQEMSTAQAKREWELADRLHSAAIHLLRRLRIQDLASGIGPAKLSALSVLVFSGRPLTLAELAAGMQRERLVRVTPAKEDARSILITPTKLGRDLLLAGKQRRVESLAKALKQCGDPQLESLERSAEVLDQVIRRIANV